MNTRASSGLPQRTRWDAVLMLAGFAFLGHFNRVGISVVGKQLIAGGTFSEVEMGTIYSAFLLVYTICMLPGGWWIDRVGPAAALRWMGIGFGIGGILTGLLGWIGLAPAALWWGLFVVRSAAGAMSTPLHPGAARGVSLWSSFGTRSTANGLVTAGALVGIALTFPGFGGLINALGWPGACIAGGGMLCGFTILWSFVAPPRHESPAETNAGEPGTQRVGLGSLLKNRSLLLLTASYATVGYFQYLFFYWMEFYFGETLKLPESESRNASFTVTMAMAAGMAVGGRCSDELCVRFGVRWGRRMTALVGMGLSALFAVFGVAVSDPKLVVLLFSLALGSLGLCEGLFWTASTELGGRIGGTASAVLNTGGNLGGVIAPVLTPWLAESYGWTTAIGVACAICAIGGGLWMGIAPAASAEAAIEGCPAETPDGEPPG